MSIAHLPFSSIFDAFVTASTNKPQCFHGICVHDSPLLATQLEIPEGVTE
jgi:hypothetical protein